MRCVIQRVRHAKVVVDGRTVGEIGPGILALVAVVEGDTPAQVDWMADKLVQMRIFRNDDGSRHFDRDIRAVAGSILLVSQFTLAADTRRGRRPSFDPAAAPDVAHRLFDDLVAAVAARGVAVATGEFGAMMEVSLLNDGPATFILDSSQ